jgi:topoisomerase-4 subunit A
VGGRKFVVASHAGNGFIVKEDDGLANTRKGKQVLNLKSPDEARAIAPATGDTLAVIGENRKMVLFPLRELPEMGRGRGVRLQRYKDGGLSNVRAFDIDDGLSWTDSADRTTTLSKRDLADWQGKRADAGRIAPKGFPKSNRFK